MAIGSAKVKGKEGEDLAVARLEAEGYVILDRNVRPPGTGGPGGRARGEIDLIARHGEDLVFVEVKLRQDAELGDGAEAISPGKIRALARSAQSWLDEHGWGDSRSCRCDVVDILADGARPEGRIIVYRDALPLWEYLR